MAAEETRERCLKNCGYTRLKWYPLGAVKLTEPVEIFTTPYTRTLPTPRERERREK